MWAPWRLDYIRGPKSDSCIFCEAVESGDDRKQYVVHRGERCFVLLNAYPYNNGHVMVAPYKHCPSIEELDAAELTELMVLAQQSIAAIREVYGADGFNLGINQGAIAGAGIEEHMHLHVVPRWSADTNFMPVIGHTRVLPQALDQSWEELTRAWPR